MKSIEAKFNAAIAKLKATASPAKFTEVYEKYSKLPTIEAKLNCVEAAIGEAVKESDTFLNKSIIELEEAKKDHGILFGIEPRTTTKEAAPIKKHNGAGDTFVEGNPFNQDRSNNTVITEADPTTKKKEAVVESMCKKSNISEAEARSIMGLKPKSVEMLNEKQKKDFEFARAIGISEADALRLAKL